MWSMTTVYIYGKDTNDSLLLSYVTTCESSFLESFKINKTSFIPFIGFLKTNKEFLKSAPGFSKEYIKDDNYNFEETLKDFKNLRPNFNNTIHILKNDWWYTCSAPDYILTKYQPLEK